MSGELKAKLKACPSGKVVEARFKRLPPECVCPKKYVDPLIKQRKTKEAKETPKVDDGIDCAPYNLEPQYSLRIETDREIIKAKYEIPKTPKQIEQAQKRRAEREKELNLCKYTVLRMPTPPDLQKLDDYKDSRFESDDEFPRKTSSYYEKHPVAPKKEDLELRKPKSGIFVNEEAPVEPKPEIEEKDSIFSCYPYTAYCICGGEDEGEDEEEPAYLGERRKRKKFFAVSRATSVGTIEKKPSKDECICKPCFPKKKVKDPVVYKKKQKDPRFDFSFYYGSKLGTTSLTENLGLCCPVVAYCFSHTKHPSKWTESNIDEILKIAQDFYKEIKIENPTPNELPKFIIMGKKKIKFEVSQPEVAGTIKSTDKKIYNLSKAMQVFFKKQKSGILQTTNYNMLFWKDRYYYLFDSSPRNKELYHCCKGAAALGHFYTLKELIGFLVKRSNFDDTPFNIYSIAVTSIENKDKPEPAEETYKLICDKQYGIIRASWDLGDRHFGFARNKQSFCIALVALLESKISPASSWTKETVDKIMVLANRLHINLSKLNGNEDYYLDFEDIPGVIQVGPYWIELYIKPNCFVGCMDTDFTLVFVQKHFQCHSSMFLQIDRCHLAIWRQRGMFFMFDPYIRDCLGMKASEGYSCITLHEKIDTVVNIIKKNFSEKCLIFRINTLKYCHITPCPIDRCDCRKAAERIDENVPTPVCSKIKISQNVKDFDICLPKREQVDLEKELGEDEQQQTAELIVDLDSSSLSETQIEPKIIVTPTISGPSTTTEEESEVEAEEWNYCICDLPEDYESYDGEGDRYYYAKSVTTQVGSHSLLSDVEMSPIPKNLLQPTLYKIPTPFSLAIEQKKPKEQLSITASEEWNKKSVFTELPDGTQIVLGTRNLLDLEPEIEFAAPFTCIMAATVAKLFSLSTWTEQVVDYVLACGNNLYQNSTARFDQVYKIEISLITLGDDDFNVEVEYCMDSTIDIKVIEDTLLKMLPIPAIFVTPVYSCAIMEKHHLYYLFDCFPSNKIGFGDGNGVAYLARFKKLKHLIHRILHNKKQREIGESYFYDRFVLSYCTVTIPDYDKLYELGEEDGLDEPIEVPEPKIIKGYQEKDGVCQITGSSYVESNPSHPDQLGTDFFVCIIACLKLFNNDVESWDNKMVDKVIDQGKKLASYAGYISIGQKLTVRNLLVDGYFFDFVLRSIKQVERAIKSDYLLVQNSKQFILYHKVDKVYHVFDPCATPAGWTKITNYESTIRGLKKVWWYGFEITSFKKAPKYLQEAPLVEKEKQPPFKLDKPFYEDSSWLDVELIPWSPKRKPPTNHWYYWYEIYPDDLYVLWGKTHQNEKAYGRKATLANIMVAAAFIETYPLDQWSVELIESILKYGEIFFKDVSKAIKKKNYQLRWEDFKQIEIPPYSYDFQYNSVVDGTMYLLHPNSFNLYKALKFFFSDRNRRIGVLTRSYRKAAKKFVLFGKLDVGSYFMYDCQSFCLPLFRESEGVSYILRATSLNRLLHSMVLTLKGGDFFISEVQTTKNYI